VADSDVRLTHSSAAAQSASAAVSVIIAAITAMRCERAASTPK